MRRNYPPGISRLPLTELSSQSNGDDLTVQFVEGKFGRWAAYIYDDHLLIVDILTAHTFMECYGEVIKQYPTARWNPDA